MIRRILFIFICSLLIQNILTIKLSAAEILRYHPIVLDSQNKLLPWYTPLDKAYDNHITKTWSWLATVPNANGYPMYYLHCCFIPGNPITPQYYENDWGEKLPNMFEFARLSYAYNGDMKSLNMVKGMLDHAINNGGISNSTFIWPGVPYGTADSGAAQINGKNNVWQQYDILTDLAGELATSYYKAYLIFGNQTYRNIALSTADTFAKKMIVGTVDKSPLPYVVNAKDGSVKSVYHSNLAGTLRLFDLLIENNEGTTTQQASYENARSTLKNWILTYPMQNGKWVDAHSDVYINGNTNLSNTAKSNMNLYLLDNPNWDSNFLTHVPMLLKWTEDTFVKPLSTSDGNLYASTNGVYYGASVPSEQTAYMARMGYQAARQGAEYSFWSYYSGDSVSKDKGFRGLNYNTYMMDTNGMASDGPTDGVGWWYGDVYGEASRMYFIGFTGLPEMSPKGENHILYSKNVLKNVSYATNSISYIPTNSEGIEFIKTNFNPTNITINGSSISLRTDLNSQGYTKTDLGNGDYYLKIRRSSSGNVSINTAPSISLSITPTVIPSPTTTPSPSINLSFDVNKDGFVNLLDVIAILNEIFR